MTALLFFLMGFSSSALVTPETEKAAEKLGASFVTQIDFKPGNTAVSVQDRQAISKIIAAARSRGDVDEVKVIAWADKEYPASGEKPSGQAVELADKRGDAVKKVIAGQKNPPSVNVYNMAKRPNAVQELLQTPAAKVKDTMESSGAAPTTGEDTGIFGIKSKASSAVVLVYMKR